MAAEENGQITESKVRRGLDFFPEVDTEEALRVIKALTRGVTREIADAVDACEAGELSYPDLFAALGLQDDPRKLEKADRIVQQVAKFNKNKAASNAYEDLTALIESKDS